MADKWMEHEDVTWIEGSSAMSVRRLASAVYRPDLWLTSRAPVMVWCCLRALLHARIVAAAIISKEPRACLVQRGQGVCKGEGHRSRGVL